MARQERKSEAAQVLDCVRSEKPGESEVTTLSFGRGDVVDAVRLGPKDTHRLLRGLVRVLVDRGDLHAEDSLSALLAQSTQPPCAAPEPATDADSLKQAGITTEPEHDELRTLPSSGILFPVRMPGGKRIILEILGGYRVLRQREFFFLCRVPDSATHLSLRFGPDLFGFMRFQTVDSENAGHLPWHTWPWFQKRSLRQSFSLGKAKKKRRYRKLSCPEIQQILGPRVISSAK